MQKIITLPDRMLSVVMKNEHGVVTETGEKVKAFLDCTNILIENIPSKNETDVFLSRSIRDKIDACKDSKSKSILLEDSEIYHLMELFKSACEKGIIIGSKWYDFLVPLREAKKPESKKKD